MWSAGPGTARRWCCCTACWTAPWAGSTWQRSIRRPCFAVDLPGFGDSDRPTRNRVSAYAEDVQAAWRRSTFTTSRWSGIRLVALWPPGWQNGCADEVAALVLIAPAGFGRIHLAEAIGLPGVRAVVHHALPLALANPVTAFGVYMAVVGNWHLPEAELAERLRKNAFRWAPGRGVRERGDHGIGALAPRVLPAPA